MRGVALYILLACSGVLNAQLTIDRSGQEILSTQYGYDEEHFGSLAAQIRASVHAEYKIDSTRLFDLEFSGILTASTWFPRFIAPSKFEALPYRFWLRYAAPQWQITAGLQKIDFGSASILRPLQWFNEIDPRDPIGLTRGVSGIVYRYVFLNNTNVWLWGLYGNDRRRGLDILPSTGTAEFGGRFQVPIPRGELAWTYHYRQADISPLGVPLESVPEHKFGIDGKWDVVVGLWTELVFSMKQESIGPLTYQKYLNLGTDYTFSIGNGLNTMVEHLLISLDSDPLGFEQMINLTALTMGYSIGFYDAIQLITYYNWSSRYPIAAIQYRHDFRKFSTFVIAYYNPPATTGLINNDLAFLTSGPGIRILFNFNH